VVYQPQEGMQELFHACPFQNVLLGGARGPGKTYAMCADFMIHALTYGRAARGLLVRRTYSELEEIERVTNELYQPLGAVYLYSRRMWLFPNGATLKLRYLKRDADADSFHGHQYSWLGVDEGGNFPTPAPIDKLYATLRSPEGVPVQFRISANPAGVGHNWLKERYVKKAPPLTPFKIGEIWACYIPGRVWDNKILLKNDPTYPDRIRAFNPPHIAKAWLDGDWDVGAGLFFDDIWQNGRHSVLRPFRVPESWRIERSFDYGSARPFWVGWWAIADGTGLVTPAKSEARQITHFVRGSRILIREWYGWNGKPNEGNGMTAFQIAEGIKLREDKMREKFGYSISPGPADTNIWDVHNGETVINDFEAAGVYWHRANKGPGSRKPGAQLMRSYQIGRAHV